MTILLAYIIGALSLSFVCSMLEAVLLSITPAFVAQLEQEGHGIAVHLKDMKSRVDRPLAAILSFNTVSHTLGAAGAGGEAQRLWGSDALAIVSVLMTLAILIASEIVPKTLGALYWRQLTPFTVQTLRFLIVIQLPLIWLSEKIGQALKPPHEDGDHVSRDEMAALAQLGQSQGVFDERESRILQNLMGMSELRTHDIMTPRTVMFSLPTSVSVREFVERRDAMQFSRVPVFGENPDDIRGYVLKNDVYLRAAKGDLDRKVGELVRSHMVVPESLPVPELFERLLDRREHIAVVVDEYGGVDGVVTMEDVLETLLGLQIVDEADRVKSLREMARAKWRERAKLLGTEIVEPDREDAGPAEG